MSLCFARMNDEELPFSAPTGSQISRPERNFKIYVHVDDCHLLFKYYGYDFAVLSNGQQDC